MANDQLKQQAAQAALQDVEPGMILGIGTGSTVSYFITALAKSGIEIAGAVSSSEQTTAQLKAYQIPVLPFNDIAELPLYIDSADEINSLLQLIKGGGGALMREKILAYNAKRFICIADASKQVKILGKFPLPVEVLPDARSFVARQLIKLGGQPVYREKFTTDNQQIILDVHHLNIMEPIKIERAINDIPGVIANGLFAMRAADKVILATSHGIQYLAQD